MEEKQQYLNENKVLRLTATLKCKFSETRFI